MAPLRLSIALLGFYTSQVLASCAYGTHLMRRAEAGETVKVNTFGYSGAIGPLNWAALDPANALCSTGTRQSPIDMADGTFNVIPGSTVNLQIPDMTNGTTFENLGTTVEVIAESGGSMSVGGVDYTLRQFHFHLPSEHLDNGTSMAMEMHMVFESAAQQIAVIGTYIGINEAPAAAAPAAPAAPVEAVAPVASTPPVASAPHAKRSFPKFQRRQAVKEQNAKRAAGVMGQAPVTSQAVASTLLETVLTQAGTIAAPGSTTRTPPLAMSEVVNLLAAGSFQSYMGSLTTPPCSEGVQWLVSTQKLSIEASTFIGVRDVIGFNSRFTQNAPGQPNAISFARAAQV